MANPYHPEPEPEAKRRKSSNSPFSGLHSTTVASSNAATPDLPAPTFDLEIWSGNYDGLLLPYRLAHIALRCTALRQQALSLAISTAKSGNDVQLYSRLCDTASQIDLPHLAVKDSEWMSKREEANRRELARLESELRGYKNNLIRESIRMGQEDLAVYHLSTGGPVPDPNNPATLPNSGLNAAYTAFNKMRDHANTPSHIAGMTLRQIFTGLLQAVQIVQSGGAAVGYFTTISQNSYRLRTSGVKEEEQAKLTPVAGVVYSIAQLGLGNYKAAAEGFKSVPFEYSQLGPVHGHDFTRQVASANDVAIYGGLTALATMSREELQTQVLSGSFRAFLELEPHMRKAISLYTTAKYQACLSTLRRYYSDWNLDIFLGGRAVSAIPESHVDRLLAKIREKSITAYFSSFSGVSLSSLADTFPPAAARSSEEAVAAMEVELLTLIQSGALHARLDVVNGLLVAPPAETRASAHEKARQTAEEVERGLILRLGKVAAVVAGVDIKQTAKQAGGGSWSVGGEGVGLPVAG
ncbi:hypothetical protein K431DRAFT_235089 [Polychaeton citri CBS 116435]|uniref:PCI domain-containing protein n=1 Tax=Polychaeton citri CBS 116435 TaxID=1314669 RepID=A0A9P4PZA1_9PEZI|nr:hypothetical protein K431DRAFT_235089 [Polychaeton citri CBS 116435]